jgi:hypothetical protein
MRKHFPQAVWVALPFLACLSPLAAQAPEALLSADTTFYFRLDGIEQHRNAYEKTALAEVMRGDMGDFVDYATTFLKDNVAQGLLRERALQGVPPKQLTKIQNTLNQIPNLIKYFKQHGVVLGAEVSCFEPFQGQLTLVFPNGNEEAYRSALLDMFQTIALLAEVEIKETKIGNRTIYEAQELDGVQSAWWQEGKHLIYVLSSDKIDRTLEVLDGKRPNLTSAPLFASMNGFKKFDSLVRGFLDVEKVLKAVLTPGETGNKLEMLKQMAGRKLIISKLGLDGLKSLTFHYGFEKQYQRVNVSLNVVEPKDRKGVLQLFNSTGRFEMNQLPALPPDATSVAAIHLDWANIYDVIADTALALTGALSPGDVQEVQNAFRELDRILGIDLRKDLLATLDSLAVISNSPGDGPLFLGISVAFKVKDEK